MELFEIFQSCNVLKQRATCNINCPTGFLKSKTTQIKGLNRFEANTVNETSNVKILFQTIHMCIKLFTASCSHKTLYKCFT